MSAVVIQYRIKGEHAEDPVHTFEIHTDDNLGVSLYDMKKHVADDNSITKWLIPSMRVLKQNGERPKNGMVSPNETYTVLLYGGSPELENALLCFTPIEIKTECIPRLGSFDDSVFLNSLIKHTLEDAQKWYSDTKDFESTKVTLHSLIHGIDTLAKVTENIRILMGEDETEFISLLRRGFSFIKNIFLDAPEQQKRDISDILIHILHLFSVLTPSQYSWTEPGPEKKEVFNPIFSVVTKHILEEEEEKEGGMCLLDSLLDIIKLLNQESYRKIDVEVIKECIKTLGAIAYRNMIVLETLGSDKGKLFFDIFKTFLSNDSDNIDIDTNIKILLFEIKRILIQFIMLGSEYSMVFSKCADEFEMLSAVIKAIFWTVEAFTINDNPTDCYCDNEGYIIENVGQVQGLWDDKKEAGSAELTQLIETIKYISFRETTRSDAFLNFLIAELFNPNNMSVKVKSMLETFPELQYKFLEMLTEYVKSGKPSRICKIFTQKLLDVLFSQFFIQIGSETNEESGKTIFSTKKCFVRLRQKTCEFILLASYTSKEARILTVANMHKIASETEIVDLFVISSEIITSMFSHFTNVDETQTLNLEETFELINMILPIYRENTRRKGSMFNNKPFKCVQMRYESSLCTLMNSCFFLLKNPIILQKIIDNERIINFFIDMLRDIGAQTFSLSCLVKLMSAPMENDEQIQIRKGICEKFLECTKGFIKENTEDEFEMELQLLRAIGEVCLAGKKYQRLMINSGVYSVIMSLLILPMEGYQERKDKLVEECLGALYYVLIGCEKNKVSFKKFIGYNNFTNTLKDITETITDQLAVMNKLFDMLVETRVKWGPGSSSDVIPTIRHPQILFVILDLVASFETDNIVRTLTRLIELLGSMPNRNICCKNGVLTYLINKIDCYSNCAEETENAMISKEISFITRINTLFIEIIHILGSHTLSASEFKHIIRILSFSGPSKTRLPDFPYLIYALHQMPSSVNAPETYFGFNGISSKFLLPKFEKGVFSKGLTINMWIRVESYKKPVIDVGYGETTVEPQNYNPVLLSLNGTDGQKMEVYLQDKILALRVSCPEVTFSNTFGTCRVPEQEWICIGITMSSTSLAGFRAISYINGVQMEKIISKHQHIGPFSNNMLGGSPTGPSQTFFGQLGNFNIFGDTLSQGQMKAIYRVGPNYLGLFNEEEMKDFISSGGSFDNDLILSYNARAQKGKFILNSCVAYANSGAKIKNIETCTVTKIKDVISCAEGIQVLFPLLLTLNKPSHPDFTSPYTDQQLLIFIIELINDLVASSNEIEEDMIKNKGYMVLSHVLRKIPSNCFTPELIKLLKKSYHNMDSNRELQKLFINDFVTDFFLWIYTPVETQKELFAMLKELYKTERRKQPVWIVLAMIQMFYWTRTENKEWRMCTVPRINLATKAVNGARPPETKIEEIRRIQYEIIRIQLENNEFDKKDIQSIIAFLCMETTDKGATIGVLRTLNAIFSSAPQIFADKFYEEKGLDVLVSMLSTDSEELLVSLIGLIQILVTILSGNQHFCENVNAISIAMGDNLSGHVKMTLSIYKMLLGMCITDNPTPMTNFKGQDNYILTYPEFYCHCVLPLSASAAEPIRIAAIHDTCLLLERPANVDRFILFPGWQSVLVNIFIAQLASSSEIQLDVSRGTPEYVYDADVTGDDLSDEEELKRARQSTFDVICTILRTIGLTSVVGPSEWKSFESLLAALQVSEQKNGSLTNIIYHMKIRFYKALTESFKPKAGMPDAMRALYKKGTPQFQKACYTIVFILDDIFAMHSNNPLSDSQNVCTILFNIIDFMSVSHITNSHDWCGCDKPKPGSSVVGASLGLRNGGFAGLYIWLCTSIAKMKYLIKIPSGCTSIHKAIDYLCKYCEDNLPGFFGAFNDDFYYVSRFLIKFYDKFKNTEDVEYFSSVLSLVVNSYIKKRIKKFTDETTTSLNKALDSVTSHLTEVEETNYLATAISADEGIANRAKRFRNDVLQKNVTIGLKANTAFVESIRMYTEKITGNDEYLLIEERYTVKKVTDRCKSQTINRLQQSCRSLREGNAEAAHKWRKIIRSLSSGNGPWGTAEAIVNWKLDEAENSSRMRVKMKRNYSFDIHDGAAVMSTRSRQPSAPPSPTMKFTTEISAAKDAWMMLSTTLSSKKASKVKKSDGTNADGVYDEDEDVDVDDIEKREGETETLYETSCNVIRPGKIYTGILTVRKDGILFVEASKSKSKDNKRVKKMFWKADMIREVHFRRYLLVHTALEIFFTDSTNVFLNFTSVKIKEIVHKKIVSGIDPPNLSYGDSKTSQEILESSGLTEQWVNGEISNFDYLMKLNTIAGRTYNDLRQYPVFPWIIADYTSDKLDFNNPEMFRDLSKPVGALNPKRLNSFRQRYENFCDPNVPPFMYATHYSSADITFFYLLRVEPFTTYYVRHLRGHFDLADRMFGSIAKTWHNCLHGNSDIKELIPEFFYFPDFLRNSNNFDFGETQAGVKLNDVELPPWAHNSPEEFIRMNRAALESPYVSMHLHEWIDLIFGYKQRGKAAEEANNIFCFFTYEGAVDINKIDNEIDRIAMRDQIANFGQTPTQLLTKPHPQKKVPLSMTSFITPSFLHERFFKHLNESFKTETITANDTTTSCDKKIVFVATPESVITDLAFSFVSDNPNRLLTVDCLYNINTTINANDLFLLSEFEKEGNSDKESGDESDPSKESKKSHSLAHDKFTVEKTQRIHGIKDDVNNNFFSLTDNGAFMLCCGFWDNSFRILGLEESNVGEKTKLSMVQKVIHHKDLVTCIYFNDFAGVVATGSRDTSIMLWNIIDDNPIRVDNHPFNVLYGHNDEVVSLDINVELDIAASCAKDGCLMVHNIRNGGFVWSEQVSEAGDPTMLVKITPIGNIVVYSPQRSEILVYNVNGRLLSSQKYGACSCEGNEHKDSDDEDEGCRDIINDMAVILDGDVLVTCGTKKLCFWRLCDMKICFSLDLESPAYCIHVSKNEVFYYVGMKNGKVLVLKA